MAEVKEMPAFEEVDMADKKPVGNVHEVTTASVALAAAVEAQKPKLFHRSMWKLWFILSVGYLISTMNGFDSSLMVRVHTVVLQQGTILTSTGFYQCHGNLPKILQFDRSWILYRHHLHHIQSRSNCCLSILRHDR